MIRFSFIIPHKNTPALLQRCLNSIPRRNDVQIIVVDDDSDIDVVDFNHFPGLQDPDVEVYFTKEGRGAGYARNAALKHAVGEWILFADADDYFFTNNLNILLDSLSELDSSLIDDCGTKCDIVTFGSKYVYTDGQIRWLGFEPNNDMSVMSSKPSFVFDTNVSLLYKVLVMPWAKMVRRSFLEQNKIQFEEVRWGNDEIYSTLVAMHTSCFSVAQLPIYCHERLKGSLVENNDVAMYKCRAMVALRKNKILMQYGYEPILEKGWLGALISQNYCLFLHTMFREWFILGWHQAWYDYCVVCDWYHISKWPHWVLALKIWKRLKAVNQCHNNV